MLRTRFVLACYLAGLLLGCALLAQQATPAEPSAQEPAQEGTPQPPPEPAQEAEPAPPAAAEETETAPAPAAQPPAQPEPAPAAPPTGGVRERMGRAWSDFMVPLWESFVATLPGVTKAVLFLIGFWILALFLGWLTTAALGRTELDNRLATDLGLGATLERWEKKGTSLEKVLGAAVKWVVLLFGFVAFFNALELEMVAGPLNNVLDQIASAVPALLKAFAYLAIYWTVATLLKLAISRGLSATGFDERVSPWIKPREIRGEMVGPSSLLGRLVFWVVLLFGLAPFLEALGQEAAVAPLRDMMSKVFAFLPNVVAALILLLVARIVATVVREVVVNFLAATGIDGLAERLGLQAAAGRRKLSEIVGAIAYFVTLIPILVAAVDALQIAAISEPVKGTLEQLLAAVPLIFVAALVVFVGYWIASTVRTLVEGFLEGIGFDSLPEKLQLGFLLPKGGEVSLSRVAGAFVMVVILLLTAQQALATLQLEQLAGLIGGLLAYLPRLLAGLAIIVAALSLGSYVGRLIASLMDDSVQGVVVSRVAQYAIYFLGFSMGLSQLGVAEDIITVAVTAVLGGSALALALAFGLGGQESAKEFLARYRPGR